MHHCKYNYNVSAHGLKAIVLIIDVKPPPIVLQWSDVCEINILDWWTSLYVKTHASPQLTNSEQKQLRPVVPHAWSHVFCYSLDLNVFTADTRKHVGHLLGLHVVKPNEVAFVIILFLTINRKTYLCLGELNSTYKTVKWVCPSLLIVLLSRSEPLCEPVRG